MLWTSGGLPLGGSERPRRHIGAIRIWQACLKAGRPKQVDCRLQRLYPRRLPLRAKANEFSLSQVQARRRCQDRWEEADVPVKHVPKSKFNLAERLFRTLLSRGTRVQISSWSLRLRFNLSRSGRIEEITTDTAAGEHLPPAAQRGVVCHRPPIPGSNLDL